VASPGLVLQNDVPSDEVRVRNAHGSGDGVGLLVTDVRSSELDVLPVCREFYLKILDALVEDAVAEDGAAAHEAVTDRHQVEDVGHDARGQTLGRKGELPAAGLGSVREQF